MKHAIAIIFFMSVLVGCSSQPPAIDPYQQPVIKNLVYILQYTDFARTVNSGIPETIDLATRFQAAFTTDDVKEITNNMLDSGHTLTLLTETTNSAVKTFTDFFKIDGYDEGIPLEYLYQYILPTVHAIEYWYTEVEVFYNKLKIMRAVMDKYSYTYK
jgi:hypothetical protein